MAAKFSHLEDQVTCAICLDQYQDPRMLPCQHTYCRQCLEKVLDKGPKKFSIECPECRKVVQVEDVSSLKVNIWVNRYLSLLELSKAEEKQKNQANVQEIPTFCDKHKEEKLKVFCKTCEEVICSDCAIIEHKKHDFCFAVDTINDNKEELTKALESAVSIKTTFAEVEEQKLKEILALEKAIDKTIDNQMQIHIQAFEKKRKELKEDAKVIREYYSTSPKKGTQSHLSGLTSAIELAENLLTKGSPNDILTLSKDVRVFLLQHSEELKKVQQSEKVQIPGLHVTKRLWSNGIEEFATVAEPDPSKCEVLWSKEYLVDSIEVHIKDHRGRPLNIDKDRITIHSVQDGSRCLVFEGFLQDRPLQDGLLNIIHLMIHKTRPACATETHRSLFYQFDVDFKVDGHIVRGTPITLCFSKDTFSTFFKKFLDSHSALLG